MAAKQQAQSNLAGFEELTETEQKALHGEEVADEPAGADGQNLAEKPVPEPTTGRDERGRFAAADQEPQEQPESQESASQPEAGKKPQQQVPLSALLEERREYQRKLDERDKLLAKGNERMEQLFQRFVKPPEQPRAPTVDEAPLDVLRDVQQRLARTEEATRQQFEAQQLAAHISGQTESFRAQAPDYDQAYNYAKQSRAAELRALGYPEHAIPQQIAQDEAGIALQAIQQGRNPAELVYAYANARGYKKPEPQQQQQQQSQQPDRIGMQQRGQQAARSLSQAGGAAPVKLTLESIAQMDDAQFAQLNEDDFRRIMGG